jgi:hypothetical protein
MMMRDRQKQPAGYNARYLIFESIAIFSFKQKVKTAEYFLIPNYMFKKFVFIRQQTANSKQQTANKAYKHETWRRTNLGLLERNFTQRTAATPRL